MEKEQVKKDNDKKVIAKEDRIRKPSFFIYFLPILFLKPIIKWKFNLHINNKEIKKLKGPTLALQAHASQFDIVTAICSLFPKRYNIVAAKDLFTWKALKPFINAFGAIPITQLSLDLTSIRKMKNAIDQNRNVLLYPEGRTSLDGKELPFLSPAIAKLVKILDCNVVVIESKGNYLTKPRYYKGLRRGRIETYTRVLYTKEQVKDANPKEIFERIKEHIKFNDNVWQQENNIEFKGKNLAHGLDYILYKCPNCETEYEMSTSEDILTCNHCGNKIQYTKTGHLVSLNDLKTIDRIDLWMDYERASIQKELENEDFKLSKEVTVLCRDEIKHEYIEVGKGSLSIDKENITFNGQVNNEEKEFIQPLAKVPTIITKNTEGIDLVFDDITYRFLFVEHKYSTKYGLIVEELFRNNNQK
ncbi:MAG: 1-acyl-sn-glycerol-3-phosphate acyltransferase [Clostridia bacterium]|nr:1-acyl-sn-glycerol-3-phosphate acyltransferase [Clostridia bacterium]